MRQVTASSFLAASILCVSASLAGAESGIFGGTAGLDPSFCAAHPIRETVVYVDETILVDGDTGWARTIYDKLKATLIPGELTTLVDLSPTTGQSTEVWRGCWPAFSPAQQARIARESHFFSESPLASLKDQQNYFTRDFGVAAEKIQQKGQRPASAVEIDPANPPQKSVLRALASDGARYAHADDTIRAIIYSDLAENSDLGSVFKPDATPTNYGEKLGTYLRRSVFYAFGVGTDLKGSGTLLEQIRAFWNGALRSMSANIGGFGSDLNVPNVVPVFAKAYNVALQDNGNTLIGRLSLLADSDGTLVDSWIGITRLSSASINGIYRCTGPGDAPSCTVSATTSSGIVSTGPAETLTLSSHGSDSLAGTIGVQGSTTDLPLTATPSDD